VQLPNQQLCIIPGHSSVPVQPDDYVPSDDTLDAIVTPSIALMISLQVHTHCSAWDLLPPHFEAVMSLCLRGLVA
jgi:hypothetical protein